MSKNLFENLIDETNEIPEIDPEVFIQQLLDNPDLVQHVTRTKTDGDETVVGYFRIPFERG